MRINAFDRFIIGGIIGGIAIGFIANTASSKIQRIFPEYINPIIHIILFLLGLWLIYLTGRFIIELFRAPRYAVEAFILDDSNNLLLYRHQYHKKRIPPGGRVRFSEFPHEAIFNRLRERLGLLESELEFVPEFHTGLDDNTGALGDVQRVPAPFLVQRELRRQRSFSRYHYDFVYVMRLTNPRKDFSSSQYSPITFVGLADLRSLVADHQSFADVENAYQKILKRLKS